MIRVGYWYDVEPTNKGAVQIKLIPSERWLESQDSKYDYYEVLEWRTYPGTKMETIVSVINGTKTECLLYIDKNYKVKDNLMFMESRIESLKKELVSDISFLQKSVDKKYKEISYHIKDAIDFIDRLDDYEAKGLGDIEY